MIRRFIGLMVLVQVCGCGDSTRAPLSTNALEIGRLISVLDSNVSVRAIKSTESIRTNLLTIVDCQTRKKMIDKWKQSLYGIAVDNLTPTDRFASIREAHRMVSWDVVGALWDLDASYEAAWDVYLEALGWLDAQCEKMKPRTPSEGADVRQEIVRWKYYQALAEYRESVVERLELDCFDKRVYKVSDDQIDAVKLRLEKIIGRRVRQRDEIKTLGKYAKDVRARIEGEMKTALECLR